MTQDKRIKKSRGRKYLWWFICLALVFCIVVVAILAATGVIFASSPTTPVESRNFNDKDSKVAAAGFFVPNRTESTTTTSTTALPMDAFANTVPNVVDGQLTFKNMQFKPEYENPENPEFMRIAKSLSRELQDVLEMNNDMDNVLVTVTGFKAGSVIANYRVSWTRKDRDMGADDSEWVKESIKNYVMESNGRVMNEFVGLESVNTIPVTDKCIVGDMR